MVKLMKRRAIALAVGGTMLLHAGGAFALGLLDAYQAALKNDPQFQSAFYDFQGGKEYENIGRSNLLPTVQGNYSGSKSNAHIVQYAQGLPFPTAERYIARNIDVEVRQPVFALDALAKYREGKAQTKAAEATFNGQQQELISRLVGSYIDALYADDQVALATAQRDTLIEQRKVNDRMFTSGEGTRTDMLETQSKLDVAEASLLEALDNQVNMRTVLAGVVGMEITGLDTLVPNFRFFPLQEGGLEEWKRLAKENNPDLRAQEHAIEIAHQELRRDQAGHFPRMDIVADYAKASSQTVDTINEDSNVKSIGFQIVIPIYSGGGISAQARQGAAALAKAHADYDAKADKALTDLRKQYNIVVSSVAKINAGVKAVESSELLIKATEQSIKGGVRINLDLLNAKQQFYTSKRDLAQSRYNYLVAVMRLRADAGILSFDDVRELASYFH